MAKGRQSQTSVQLATTNAALAEANTRAAAAESSLSKYRAAAREAKKDLKEGLAKAKREVSERSKEAAKTALEQPITDAVVETGGVILEAVVRVKKPDIAKYAPVVSFLGEAGCYYAAASPKAKKDERNAYRLGANLFRGVRARWSVEMADKLAHSLVG